MGLLGFPKRTDDSAVLFVEDERIFRVSYMRNATTELPRRSAMMSCFVARYKGGQLTYHTIHTGDSLDSYIQTSAEDLVPGWGITSESMSTRGSASAIGHAAASLVVFLSPLR